MNVVQFYKSKRRQLFWFVVLTGVVLGLLSFAKPESQLTIQCRVGGVVQEPDPAADFVAYGSDCTANGKRLESVTAYQGYR